MAQLALIAQLTLLALLALHGCATTRPRPIVVTGVVTARAELAKIGLAKRLPHPCRASPLN
jgi:hypothetical protein